MAQELNINSAMGAVNLFMSAVKNCRLYPESSDIVKNSLVSAHKRLTGVFYRDTPFSISEAEGHILFDGKVLDPRSQRMPQVESLRVLMENLNVKSIAFKRGIDSDNYAKFARLLSLPPEEVDALGGVREIMETEGISYIVVNHRVYIEADSDAVIEENAELFRQIWMDQVAIGPATMYVERHLGDPGWLEGLGEEMLSFITDKGNELSDIESIIAIARLFGLVIRTGLDRELVGTYRRVYNSLEGLGPYFNCDTLALNFDDGSIADGLDTLEDDQFNHLAARLQVIDQSSRRGSRFLSDDNLGLYQQASQKMMDSERGNANRGTIVSLTDEEKRTQEAEIKRIEAAIDELQGGDVAVLEDSAVQTAIPKAITDRIQMGRLSEAEKLIQSIATAIGLENRARSEEAVRALLQSCRAMIGAQRRDMVSRLVSPINFWVRFQDESSTLLDSVADVIVNHAHYLVNAYQFADAVPLFETFSLIGTGRLQKGETLTQMAERSLVRMASERVFNTVLGEFKKNEKERRESTSALLILMEKHSVSALLDMLRNSQEMTERIRIMNVLTEIGKPCMAEVMERIRPDTAWFYLRNLLKILGDVGSEEHIEPLLSLTVRNEEQVIEAVISCVNQIGGDKKARFFSRAIVNVSNPVKVKLCLILAQLGGDDAVYALSDLLKVKLSGSPEEKNLVTQSIIKALGEIGSIKGVPALQVVVDQKGLLGMSRFTPDQKELAKAMIQKLKTHSQKMKSAASSTAKDDRVKVTREYVFQEEYETLSTMVTGLASAGKKAQALRMLLMMVERAAREKDLDRAEAYKKRITEIDELALGEVVRAEDIIEQEKRFVDSGQYVETWKTFYDTLSEEEAADFYYHMTNKVLDVDTEVIRQGQVMDRLVFINDGSFKVTFMDKSKEIFLQQLGKGDVAGYDAFFKTNTSTANLVALTRANVGFLDRDGLEALELKHPDFVEKLKAFCGNFDNLADIVQAKGVERRRYRRFNTQGRVVLQLRKGSGETVGKPFSGELLDISEGGLSVEVKSSGYQMARLILGRNISTMMRPSEHGDSISCDGRVSSINERGENSISLHIAFAHPMEVAVLETFVTTTA